MVEDLGYNPISEIVTGAHFLRRMIEYTDELSGGLDEGIDVFLLTEEGDEIELDVETDNQESATLFTKIVAASLEQGVQFQRYYTRYPAELSNDDGGCIKEWEYIFQIYLGAIEAYSHDIGFDESAQKVILEELSLLEIIDTAYADILQELGATITVGSSLIATSMNDRVIPVARTDKIYIDEGADAYSVNILESVWMIEAFLCDAMSLTRKDQIDSPVGFSRLPPAPAYNLDVRIRG